MSGSAMPSAGLRGRLSRGARGAATTGAATLLAMAALGAMPSLGVVHAQMPAVSPSPTPMPSETPMPTPSVSPDPVPVPSAPPWSGAYLGHADASPRPYNIWVDNCHTAANAFCLADPTQCDRRGILACGGNPQGSPAHHTANWEVTPDGWTCIYNWGESCCWMANAIPPDINDGGDGQDCAQWACGAQYGGGTQVLPPGQLVEIPGYAACVRETAGLALNALSVTGADFSASNRNGCLDCCDRRADMWLPGDSQPGSTGYQQKLDFLRNCKQLCNGFFGNNSEPVPQINDSLAIRKGRQCVANTSMWVAASRYEQCRGCCLDGAQRGEYPRQQFSSCMAVCNSEYR
jgi:hypothetical protein